MGRNLSPRSITVPDEVWHLVTLEAERSHSNHSAVIRRLILDNLDPDGSYMKAVEAALDAKARQILDDLDAN